MLSLNLSLDLQLRAKKMTKSKLKSSLLKQARRKGSNQTRTRRHLCQNLIPTTLIYLSLPNRSRHCRVASLLTLLL